MTNTVLNQSPLVPSTYDFRGSPVRVVMHNGEPWFVAADVCRAIGVAGSRSRLYALDHDEKGVLISYTIRGPQKVQVVNEPGLFRLVLRSNTESAKPFIRWVTHEILPKVRRLFEQGMGRPVDEMEFVKMAPATTFHPEQASSAPTPAAAPASSSVPADTYRERYIALLERYVALLESRRLPRPAAAPVSDPRQTMLPLGQVCATVPAPAGVPPKRRSAPVSPYEKRSIRLLKRRYPAMSVREIAAKVGRSRHTVQKILRGMKGGAS